ncbi:MAG: hypothetical protein NVSMB14_18040 [Isosphaeraceae bacterium]
MNSIKRAILGASILSIGLVAQAALERASDGPRPRLQKPLATIPLSLGDWVGRDVEVDPAILKEAQADDYVNRVYDDRLHPGRSVSLWINYSEHGLNLRHSPEVCLPSSGWEKIEARCQVGSIGATGRPLTKLGYAKGELAQTIGFWYYIFGETRWERYVRSLPISSRSSHGRATRGSGLTVEVFSSGETDPNGDALSEFAAKVDESLGPILPDDRVHCYIS